MPYEPSSRFYRGARPPVTGFVCPACGAEQVGDPQRGCTACGAGKPGYRVRPVPMPPDEPLVEETEMPAPLHAPPPPPPSRLTRAETSPVTGVTATGAGLPGEPVRPLGPGMTADASLSMLDNPDAPPEESYTTTVQQTPNGPRVILRGNDGVTAEAVADTIPVAFAQALDTLEDTRCAATVDGLAELVRDSAQLLTDALTSHIDMYERTRMAEEVGVPRAYDLRERLAAYLPTVK